MKRKINFILLALLLMFVVPTIVNAETVKVKFRTNPSDSNGIASFDGERNVTTVGDIRLQAASLFDMEKYILLDNNYNVPSDEDVICVSYALGCYQTNTNEYSVYINLLEIDSTEKSFTLNSIPPKDESMAYSIFETNYETLGSLTLRSCDSTFTKCIFMDHQNFKGYNYNITYKYDNDIAKLAQKAVDDGLINNNQFEATDVELINFLTYGGSLANYTSSFKNQLSNYNFVSEIDQRGGAYEPFNTAAIGFYRATYNGTLYAIKEFVEINAPHIIYIPSDSTNKVEAVKARLKDILGNDASKYSVTESTDTINEFLTAVGEPTVGEIGNDTYIEMEFIDEDSPFFGRVYTFAAIKDSSKINNSASFKSKDLLTNVSVSTDETIPLDTLIIVDHITEGETYDDLMTKLNIPEGEVFDISLKSNSQNKKIEKLDNGKFLVSIPIPDKYNGKSLIVYYVNGDKVTEYTVTPKDGIATFETDHFSTYTLAINNSSETTTTVENISKASSNPKTADNIIYYALLLIVSTLLLVGTKLYIKKFNK